MVCLFGHKWNGCKCEKCNKTREEGHLFQKTNECLSICIVCGRISSNHKMKSGSMKSQKCIKCDEEFYAVKCLNNDDIKLIKFAISTLCHSDKITNEEKKEMHDAFEELFKDTTWYPEAALHTLCGAVTSLIYSGREKKGIYKVSPAKERACQDLRNKFNGIFGHGTVTLHKF